MQPEDGMKLLKCDSREMKLKVVLSENRTGARKQLNS